MKLIAAPSKRSTIVKAVDEGEVNRVVTSAGASRPATADSGVTKLVGDRQDKSTRWRMAKYGLITVKICVLLSICQKGRRA
ncbi:MAG: hypothetical protein AB1374_09205 [Bacillota bacterium]